MHTKKHQHQLARRRLLTSSLYSPILIPGMLATLNSGLTTSSYAATACQSGRPYGVQAYMLREAFSEDPFSAVRIVAEMGFKEIELWNLNLTEGTIFDLSFEDFAAVLRDNNLQSPLCHVNAPYDISKLVEAANSLGVTTLIEAVGAEQMDESQGRFQIVPLKTMEQVHAMSNRLNKVGAQLLSEGLQFCYHNHHIEFAEVDGQAVFDWFTKLTDPSLVKLELDLGWLRVAGRDPVAMLQQYGERVISVHLKDYDPNKHHEEDPFAMGRVFQLVTPGAGTTDFRAIIQELNRLNVSHRYVEVDQTADPIGDALSGLCHVTSLDG